MGYITQIKSPTNCCPDTKTSELNYDCSSACPEYYKIPDFNCNPCPVPTWKKPTSNNLMDAECFVNNGNPNPKICKPFYWFTDLFIGLWCADSNLFQQWITENNIKVSDQDAFNNFPRNFATVIHEFVSPDELRTYNDYNTFVNGGLKSFNEAHWTFAPSE